VLAEDSFNSLRVELWAKYTGDSGDYIRIINKRIIVGVMKIPAEP